jgi:hypothetical protein
MTRRWRYSHRFRAPDSEASEGTVAYYDHFFLLTSFVWIYALLNAIDVERTRRMHARLYGVMEEQERRFFSGPNP